MASLFSGEGNEVENLFVRYGIRILCSRDTEKFHFVYGFTYPVMKSGRGFLQRNIRILKFFLPYSRAVWSLKKYFEQYIVPVSVYGV